MSVYELLQKESYMIGIPSRERTNLIDKRIGIWKHLEGGYPTVVVVREEEVDSYTYHLADTFPNVSLIPVPNIFTIAEKRQRLLQEAIDRKVEHLFIIDDDVDLYFRDEDLSSKYTSRREDFLRLEAFDRMLYECMALCCDLYPIVGLPLKQGSFNLRYMFPKNIPIIRFVCYHIPTLIKENVTCTGLKTTFMSDRYVQLSLLEKGYASLSNCRWCVGDSSTRVTGGCFVTRTPELQAEAATKIQARFPRAVTLKWKDDGAWGVPRLDCSINWKMYLKESELKHLPHEVGMERLRNYKEGYDV